MWLLFLAVGCNPYFSISLFSLTLTLSFFYHLIRVSTTKGEKKIALIVFFALTEHPQKSMWLLFLAIVCSNSSYSNDILFILIYKLPIIVPLGTKIGQRMRLQEALEVNICSICFFLAGRLKISLCVYNGFHNFSSVKNLPWEKFQLYNMVG